MSIQSEIDRIISVKNDLRTALKAKGATLTDGSVLADFVDAVNGLQIGGGSVDLPTVSVTADKLLNGVTAINSDGNVVTGTIQSVSLSRSEDVVSIGKGYTTGGSVTIPSAVIFSNRIDIESGSTTSTSAKIQVNIGVDDEQGGYVPDDWAFVKAVTINAAPAKEWTPGTSNQTLAKHRWLNGDQVIKGDSNLVSGNIKKGVTIFNVTGTLETDAPALPEVSITADKLLTGYTALDSNGNIVNGSMPYSQQIGHEGGGFIVEYTAGYLPERVYEAAPTATISETDTTITVGRGWVNQSKTFNKVVSGGSFVKVTEFIEPHDAYSAVSSLNVTGFGEIDIYGDMIDYSDWNGTYQVTPGTAGETSTTSRIFKHTESSKYIYYLYDSDWMESRWVFDTRPDSQWISSAEFYASSLDSTTWYSYETDSSATLAITQVATDYPAQELVLSGVSATYSDNAWTTWAAVAISAYEKKPIKYGIYKIDGGKLIGNPIAYHTEMYMPTDGLLVYLPMDDLGDVARDVVSGLQLKKMGKGVRSGADRTDVAGNPELCWECTSTDGAALTGTNTAFDLPEEFTISAWVYYVGQSSWRDCLPIVDFGNQQRDTGFGIRVGGTTTAKYSLRIGGDENGDHITGVPNNSWHHIAFTWQKKSNGSFTAKGYLDGQKVYNGDWDSYYAPTNSVQISMFGRGGTFETVSGSVPCKIDEVMLWNRVLSDAEVATLVR